MIELILCIIGITAIVIASYIHRVHKRASLMSKEPTYSKDVNRALYESGPYTTHGMAMVGYAGGGNGVGAVSIGDSAGSGGVVATSGKSRAYYETFL